MGAERIQLLKPSTWRGKRPARTAAIPSDALTRIRAQEAEMDRQIADGTFGSDAMTAEDLERKLLS